MSSQADVRLLKHSNCRDDKSRAEFLDAFAMAPTAFRPKDFRVGLLPAEVWRSFVQMPMPFAREFWVVVGEGGRVLGRVGANVSPVYPGYGYIGFFEVDVTAYNASGIAKTLLQEASDWLRAQGAKEAFGPLNYNTWFPYRFRVPSTQDGQSLDFAWEPVNPPEYVTYWAQFGFAEVECYRTQGLGGLKAYAETMKPAYEKSLANGYSYRRLDAANLFERELPILYRLSMEGFRKAFLFEPIPIEAFRRLYVPIANKMSSTYTYFALDKSGNEVGFFFSYPDQGYVVLKTAAISDQARGQGLSNAMSYLLAQDALAQGCDKLITALVRTGAQSESYAKHAELLWKHEYVLLRKPL